MKVHKFIAPYTKDGKTAFPEAQKQSGVYIIKENGIIVYIGYSGTDLYKTMYRHFQEWKDVSQIRVTYKARLKKFKYTVRVIYCTPAQAWKLEGALILKLEPRDNADKYKGFELDSQDINIIHQYQETPVQRDAPF